MHGPQRRRPAAGAALARHAARRAGSWVVNGSRQCVPWLGCDPARVRHPPLPPSAHPAPRRSCLLTSSTTSSRHSEQSWSSSGRQRQPGHRRQQPRRQRQQWRQMRRRRSNHMWLPPLQPSPRQRWLLCLQPRLQQSKEQAGGWAAVAAQALCGQRRVRQLPRRQGEACAARAPCTILWG